MADQVTIRITAEVDQAIRQIHNLTQAWVQFGTKANKSRDEARAAYDAVSGLNIQRQALATAKAIEKIGGAISLTSKEQQKANALFSEAIEKYKVMGRDVPPILTKLWYQTKQIGEESKRNGDIFNRSFFRLTGAISAADLAAKAIAGTLGLIWNGFKKVIGAFGELVSQGAKVQMISQAFESLQAAMPGQNAINTMSQLRAGTQGLVNDFDLMTAANRAMLFGLDLTGNKWQVLGEASVKLGRAMGIDAAKGMNDLVLALGRVSPRILDNLGIIVKVGEANKAWADAHKKTIQQMTGSERVLAFQELALKKIEEHVASLGGVQLTLADRLQIANVQWENWTNRVGEAISKSATLNVAFSAISNAISAVFGAGNQDSVAKTVSLIEDFAIWVFKAAENFVIFVKSVVQGIGVIGVALNETALQINRELTSIAGKVETLAKAYAFFTTGAVSEAFTRIADSMAEFHLSQAKLIAQQHEASDGYMKMAKGTDDLSQNLEIAVGWLKQTREQMEAAKKDGAAYTEVQEKIKRTIKAVSDEEEEAAQARERDAKGMAKLVEDIRKLDVALRSAEKNHVNSAVVLKELGARLTDVSQRSQIAGVSLTQAVTRWVEILDKSQPTRDKFIKQMADLEMLLQALPEDMPFADVMEEFGSAIEHAANKATGMRLAVPPLIKAWAAMKDSAEDTKKEIKLFSDGLDDSITALQAYQKKLSDMQDEFRKKRLKVGKPDTENRSLLNDEELRQSMQELGPMREGFEQEWIETASAIGAHYVAVADDIKLTWTETFEAMSKKLPKAMLDAFSGGGNVFNSIAAAIGSTLQEKLFGEQSAIGKGLQGLFNGSTDANGVTTGGLANKGGVFGAIFKTVANFIPLVGPIIGMLAGPIAKGFKRLFTGPSMEKKVAADLGRDYGQSFSDALNKKIADDAKRLGDRMGASLLHLKEIIDEAGGVTINNVNKWTAKTRDIFVLLERKIITTEEAAKSLGEVIPELAKTFEKSGGIWNAQFRELIDLAKQSGLEVEAINDLLAEQLTKMESATGQVVSGFTKPLITEFDKIAKELENTTGKTDEEVKALTAKAEARFKSMGKNAQEEFDRINRITLRTFNAMVAEGKSPIEAMDAIGASVDDLAAIAEKLGLKGNEAFQQLSRFRELTDTNRPLLEQMQGLNDLLVASINLKQLDQDGFNDLQAQGLETYKKLREAGFTESEALMQMSDLLGNIIEAHEARGLAIDGETAKLIAQADEEGLLREKQISTNEILMQGLTALIEAVGGTIPEAWKKAADASIEANRKAQRATEGTEDAASDVADELHRQKKDWEIWSQTAVDAASEAQAAVDGVSFGHSPGGLKEWEPLLNKSRKAMLAFTRDGRREMEALQRLMKDVPNLNPSPAHTGAVLSRYDSVTSKAAVQSQSGITVNGDVKISTWTLGDQHDLIRKTITPGVLKTVNDGGDPGAHFRKLVRTNTKR